MKKCLKELRESSIQAEATTGATALRYRHARDVEGAARRPVWLEQSEQGDEGQRGSWRVRSDYRMLVRMLVFIVGGGKPLDAIEKRNDKF